MRIANVFALVGVLAPMAAHAATCNTAWMQCGGQNWAGNTCCVDGYKCTYQNDWYSQCLLDPSVVTTAPATTTPVPTTAKPTTTPVPTTTATPTTAAPTTPLNLYPNYNTNPIAADSTGMSSNATTLAAKLKLGLNIGNTLEAIGGETAWGNPQITQAYVDAAKAAGFNAIRLPASWNQYANSTTAQINATWLARVKEVVNYCVKDGLYVIINIHWDGGWLEENCTPDKQAVNNEKQKAFWSQIATTLRDFDEHVIFAGANEPNVDTAAKMAVLMTYHQTFIDAVRATGGKNAYRNLIVQGPSTDIEKTNSLMTSWVTDSVANRLFAEVHYYTPYQFTLMTADEWWGKQFYYWGAPNHSPDDTDHNPTWGEETDLEKYFTMMKTQFVDKNIPVILGEFQVQDRKGVTTFTDANLALHEASRAFFYKTIVSRGRALGLIPFVWDTGSLLDRNTGAVKDTVGFNGLLSGLT